MSIRVKTLSDVRRHADDVRADIEARDEWYLKGEPTDIKPFGANFGEQFAVALAAAGQSELNVAGRRPCETDYLVAQGARFPDGRGEDVLEHFNRVTLQLAEDVQEEARYEIVAAFFHGGDVVAEIDAMVRRFSR